VDPMGGLSGLMPPGLAATSTGIMGVRIGGEMPSSASPGAAGMIPQQHFGPPSGMQQHFFVSPMPPTVPNYGCYGAPMGISGACAYAPPAAGMYQQAQPSGLYQSPQYTQQQPPQQYLPQQPHVPQQPPYVPPPQQPFGMPPPQSGPVATGYGYQTPLSGAAGSGTGGTGAFGSGGFPGGGLVGSLGAPYGGYDDSDSYGNQQLNMYGAAPPNGYFRSA